MAGLAPVLDETVDSLASGLLIAVVVIFLLLAATFQSLRIALVILSAVPFVIVGALLLLNLPSPHSTQKYCCYFVH